MKVQITAGPITFSMDDPSKTGEPKYLGELMASFTKYFVNDDVDGHPRELLADTERRIGFQVEPDDDGEELDKAA